MSAGSEAYEAWGLTGGVASGKSTVARLFEEAGIPVLDADQVARELSAPGGAAFDAIVRRFGTADRARLRALVFADAAARRDLEAILHPLIASESARRMEALARARGGSDARRVPVIYEAALLVETGRYRQLAGLIVVEAPASVRVARLMARDGMSAAEARRMLTAQTSDEERRRAASVVFVNDGDVALLRSAVKAWIIARGWGAGGAGP